MNFNYSFLQCTFRIGSLFVFLFTYQQYASTPQLSISLFTHTVAPPPAFPPPPPKDSTYSNTFLVSCLSLQTTQTPILVIYTSAGPIV